MKIKIKESQLKKVLNEVGGYDYVDVMGIHGGSLHGEITRIVVSTVDFVKEFTNRLGDGTLSREEILVGVHNLSEKIQEDIQRLTELAKEIYIDDDFKSLLISYIRTLQKILKYFKLLSNVSPGIIGNKPRMMPSGLGWEMPETELSLEIAKKLAMLGEHLNDLGEMFNTIMGRYSDRMQRGN